MHILSHMIAVLVGWLRGPTPPTQKVPEGVDWADLPTYHPSCD